MTLAQLPQSTHSMSYESEGVPLLGHTVPRLWTPPLRELTPETSYGFDVIDFARDVLQTPLDPFQEWLVIHAGELMPDGITPRFRKVLVIVARQNGKTLLLRVLKLYWLFVEEWPVIVGSSTDRSYAKKDWHKLCDWATTNPTLSALLPKNKSGRGVPGVKTQMGEEALKTATGCEYVFGANNGSLGRSLSIDRLVIDELREHRNWEAWDAATNAMNAKPYGQVYCITNQGDDTGVVLDSLRATALEFIEKGKGDKRLGLFEWSAPDGAALLDREAWAYANPNLGRRLTEEIIESAALLAHKNHGEAEAGFRTEILCQRVRALDAAVDPFLWAECHVPGDLAEMTGRMTMVADVSPDQRHGTLVAAAVMSDGRVRIRTVKAWDNLRDMRRELPMLVEHIKPKVFGWMPNGPAATLAADLKDVKGRNNWPPRGITVEELTAEVSAVCMGFAEQVEAKQIVHSDDPLLNAHITGAAKLWNGDRWRFSRKGEGHCDAAYAAAGAVHLARTLPTPPGKLRLVTVVA